MIGTPLFLTSFDLADWLSEQNKPEPIADACREQYSRIICSDVTTDVSLAASKVI